MDLLEELFKETDIFYYPVKSISMYPLFLPNRDLIVFARKSAYQLFDVILYQYSKKEILINRIVDVADNQFVVVGDNMNQPDYIYQKQIKGYAIGYIRDGNYYTLQTKEYSDYLEKNIISFNYKQRVTQFPFKPLSKETAFVMDCIRSFVKEQPMSKRCGIDYSKVFSFMKWQGLGPMLFSILESPDWKGTEYQLQAQKTFVTNALKSTLYEQEKEVLFQYFQKEGIDYLPLKGMVKNFLYPLLGTRYFTDYDLLIREEDAQRVKTIMEEVGFQTKSFGLSCHDVYIKDGQLNFELHRKLFIGGEPYAQFFEKPFELAKRIEDTQEFCFEPTTYLIYELAHMQKHIEHGGVGLRGLVDFYYLFLTRWYTNPRDEQFLNQLKELDLYVLYEGLYSICSKIFEGTERLNYNELSYYLKSGLYGQIEQGVTRELNKNPNKIKYFFSRLWPSFQVAKEHNQILIKHPILYPFVNIKRIMGKLFNKQSRKRINSELSAMKTYRKGD